MIDPNPPDWWHRPCYECSRFTTTNRDVVGTCSMGGPNPDGCSDVRATETCQAWQRREIR